MRFGGLIVCIRESIMADVEIIDDPEDEHSESEEELDHEIDAHLDAPAREQRLALRAAADHVVQQYANDPNFDPPRMPREGVMINNAFVHIEVNEADPQQREHMRDLREQIGELQQQVRAVQGRPAAAENITLKYVLATCAIASGISAVLSIIFSIKDHVSGPKARAAAAAANPETDAAALAKAWLKDSEQSFWDNLANFFETYRPRSFQEQLMFMQLTLDIANSIPVAPWTWKSPGDKLAAVVTLVKKIESDGLGAAYRILPTIVYLPENRPYTRAIGAELMSLALTQWFVANA